MPRTTKVPFPDIARLSGDSHVLEPPDLWKTKLPAKFRDRAFEGPDRRERPGGRDSKLALHDMNADGISAQVLFMSIGGNIYSQFYRKIPLDIELAKAEEQVYNDWMIEYCSADFDRLWGLALIGLWDIDYAIKEMERVKSEGLKGVAIWAAPPDDLPYSSDHYERFWAAAEEMQMPLCMHINLGFGAYTAPMIKSANQVPSEHEANANTVARFSYGHKTIAQKTACELILFGVLERHPNLKFMLGEFDVGWIPFFLEDLDRKFSGYRHSGRQNMTDETTLGLTMLPSEYFQRNFFADFMQDSVGGFLLQRWGADNFIYSNDYPHGGGIWPYTDDTILLTLADLPRETLVKVLGGNLCRLFNQPLPPPVEREPLLDFSDETWQANRDWLKKADEYTFDKPEMGLN